MAAKKSASSKRVSKTHKSVKSTKPIKSKTTTKAVTKSRSKIRVSKVVAKKTTSQPVVSRVRVYNLTRDIPSDKFFVLANGQPVKNVAELAAILDQIEDHVFSHHVNANKNDFHNWVKDVFEDVELARKITGVSDKRHMQLVIYRHMAGHE